MGASEWCVIIGGLVLAGFLTWLFFGPKQARRAALVDGVQEVDVTVKGRLHARPDPRPPGGAAPSDL